MAENALISDLNSNIEKTLRDAITKSWTENGHKLTGALIDSVKIVINENFNEILIQGYMNAYGAYMDRGVSSSSIPYTPNARTGAKTSLYIQGLMSYVSKRMGVSVGSKENKQIAFAIAAKHKKSGMPIRTGGKGTRWITQFLTDAQPQVERYINIYIGGILSTELEKLSLYGNNN